MSELACCYVLCGRPGVELRDPPDGGHRLRLCMEHLREYDAASGAERAAVARKVRDLALIGPTDIDLGALVQRARGELQRRPLTIPALAVALEVSTGLAATVARALGDDVRRARDGRLHLVERGAAVPPTASPVASTRWSRLHEQNTGGAGKGTPPVPRAGGAGEVGGGDSEASAVALNFTDGAPAAETPAGPLRQHPGARGPTTGPPWQGESPGADVDVTSDAASATLATSPKGAGSRVASSTAAQRGPDRSSPDVADVDGGALGLGAAGPCPHADVAAPCDEAGANLTTWDAKPPALVAVGPPQKGAAPLAGEAQYRADRAVTITDRASTIEEPGVGTTPADVAASLARNEPGRADDEAGATPATPHNEHAPWSGVAPATWDDVVWPAWMPAPVVDRIRQFWSESIGRGPAAYERQHLNNYAHAPAFGTRVAWRAWSPEQRVVIGRYVHMWNNIGRVVEDDGTVHCVSSGGRVDLVEAEAARRRADAFEAEGTELAPRLPGPRTPPDVETLDQVKRELVDLALADSIQWRAILQAIETFRRLNEAHARVLDQLVRTDGRQGAFVALALGVTPERVRQLTAKARRDGLIVKVRERRRRSTATRWRLTPLGVAARRAAGAEVWPDLLSSPLGADASLSVANRTGAERGDLEARDVG